MVIGGELLVSFRILKLAMDIRSETNRKVMYNVPTKTNHLIQYSYKKR